MSGFTTELEKIYAKAEPRPQSLRIRMEMVHDHPKVLAATEEFLNGRIVMGHDIGDRCAFGAVCIAAARETMPLKATPFAAARAMRQVMKTKGVPLLRSGKIDIKQLTGEAQTPEDDEGESSSS